MLQFSSSWYLLSPSSALFLVSHPCSLIFCTHSFAKGSRRSHPCQSWREVLTLTKSPNAGEYAALPLISALLQSGPMLMPWTRMPMWTAAQLHITHGTGCRGHLMGELVIPYKNSQGSPSPLQMVLGCMRDPKCAQV
jgi:hypothetical protein